MKKTMNVRILFWSCRQGHLRFKLGQNLRKQKQTCKMSTIQADLFRTLKKVDPLFLKGRRKKKKSRPLLKHKGRTRILTRVVKKKWVRPIGPNSVFGPFFFRPLISDPLKTIILDNKNVKLKKRNKYGN